MLSRTADNLYWLSRYVERAECLARILDVASRLASLPAAYGGSTNEWESAVATAGCVDAFDAVYDEANEKTVNEFLAFNRAYRQHIDIRQPGEPASWWELRSALQETDHLYQIWDTVRDARCEYYYVTVRRQALKRLREMLGEEAYYSGRLPPYVPMWRFQPIN